MSTTNTTAPITSTEEEVPYMKMFDRGGLKDLITSHQHLVNYVGTVTHTYNPMIYTLPREVAKPTLEEKAALARMIKREKELMGKTRRLIREAERDCDELLAELGFRNTGWETGWGNNGWEIVVNNNGAQGNENDDGADDNTEAN